ncbi:MAG: HAD-IA family hydrolase [Thermodesulfovibrionales bacterium]|nr:HAD-IA family hydrolase [Thermodesulfovibrionales bacterium]
MAINLILFDLDGTLVDTCVDITNAINYAIEPFDIKPLTPKETINLVGEGITRLMEKILERKEIYGSTVFPEIVSQQPIRDILVNRFLDYYSKHLTDNTTLYPGVREVLEYFKDFKKAVISNKREILSVRLLKELGILQYFDLVVGSDTTPERKPSPLPILYALSKLAVDNTSAVIVGDSSFDIMAGRKANIKTIGVTYGYRPAESLKDADFLIASIEELKNVITLL